ncbi:M48 family metalloprotease [Arsenicibacter rosenii]|uniref:Uncharacterized protein n=1 Tax=Arsenicibacter rosenii TaxID=1750698 RepID=A0A1S2VA90_9BACT|nr:M48 family metalloprotease [Arsenicibacter rosenii]OIN55654.1 hypothetical protein BLX24_28885 [Arsenicibacter rosenii]
MDQPPQEEFSWFGFVKDNIWTFIAASFIPLLQFFRSKKRDQADSRKAEVEADSAAVELMENAMTKYKARWDIEMTELQQKYDRIKQDHDRIKLDLEDSIKRETAMKARIDDLEKTVKTLTTQLRQTKRNRKKS